MTITACASCIERPKGETGHPGLTYQISGPWPGHNIFRCTDCGERWIRHYGSSEEKHAWSRYSDQFPTRTPLAAGLPDKVSR